MKRFKFEMGGMFMYYHGKNLGEAIKSFIAQRPNYIELIETITEEPYKDHELP